MTLWRADPIVDYGLGVPQDTGNHDLGAPDYTPCDETTTLAEDDASATGFSRPCLFSSTPQRPRVQQAGLRGVQQTPPSTLS